MLEITKGYKVGKAVLFYDLTDIDSTVKERVSKEDVVKACSDGQISNAKIQWWEGKPIVRCSDKNLPLVKLDDKGNVIGEARRAIRVYSGTGSRSANCTSRKQREDQVPTQAVINSTVVGKLNGNSSKKVKPDIHYGGYDKKYKDYQHKLKSTVDLKGLNTVGDLFDKMAEDFRLKNVEAYRNQISKKVDMNKKVVGMNGSHVAAIQESFAIYMMNMAEQELNETYIKYRSLYDV